MSNPEDEEQTLVFVDMLGFGALVDKYRFRVSGSSTTPIQRQFNGFNHALDLTVREEHLKGGLQAMLFSDCAYLRVGNSIRAVHIAIELMRTFIEFRVAVRMGLGKGTFYDFEYSTNTNNGRDLVSKSRFVGTAVLRAHAAEKCGGKGMRIFVDSSLADEPTFPQRCSEVMPLPDPLKTSRWELNYLYNCRPIQDDPSDNELDRKLFKAVASMTDLTDEPGVRQHYVDTLGAMNRMRTRFSRPTVDLKELSYAAGVPE